MVSCCYMQIQFHFKNPMFMGSNKNYNFRRNTCRDNISTLTPMKQWKGIVCNGFSCQVDCLVIASHLSALSLFPYMGFLYFITKSNSAPKLTLFGFYFLLLFVGAATKTHYMTFLSNVDWLHGGAESLLTLTNLFIVLGLREALRKAKDDKGNTFNVASGIKEEEKSSI
ncbi:hypothetical protein BUALT_Bualt05G0045400 [Buddleja alternifolia]|uniref:Transmembrane protein n=1 Tax=Buddleja alternifolia TaxID=168488 RepID=A0AAV6XNG1_9LAMI|nr:hypothetical protein BUALT_Bualt05G0045400 [Buddleja alternifolia]